MSLKLNSDLAKSADNIASGIKETGKYIGTITRAEALVSEKGTLGLGLSIKTADGQTADYLDLWHTKSDGKELGSLKTVNAILCCTKVADARDGTIQVEKWNNAIRAREVVTVPGYPDLMGKRIGLLLQKQLETTDRGKDVERLNIFAVFNAEKELTAYEMYAKKTNPERLSQIFDALMARPVRDNRKAASSGGYSSGGEMGHAGQDVPFDDNPF